jgi:peptidoglycan DL-endopeptidase CwlO
MQRLTSIGVTSDREVPVIGLLRGSGFLGPAIIVLVLVLAVPVLAASGGMSALTAASSSACPAGNTVQQQASAAADSIPKNYLALFQQAGREYGISWAVLAAIGKVESDDGLNDGPSSAGALGPMQFMPATWAEYGQGGNIEAPADAIPAAARLLIANGAQSDLPAAIFAYNHSDDYVTEVLDLAGTYTKGGYSVSSSAQAACTLSAAGQAPSELAAEIITYALAQLGKPYIWGGTGPAGFDCSGLIYAAYRSVGITLPRTTFAMWDLAAPHIQEGQEEPGDLVFFNTGPGSSPDHPGHVGLVIGRGQMVVANCSTCGPVATSSYAGNPTLVGFVRPLGDASLVT